PLSAVAPPPASPGCRRWPRCRSCPPAPLTVQFIGTMLLFKWGWDASVVIPIMGPCYVGTAIMGKWMLGEPVNATRWIGIVLIIVGVIFVARSVTQATAP